MKSTRPAAAFGAAAILAGAAAGCGSGSGSSSGGSAAVPSKLVVWRMGASVPSQVTWMNGVVTQFHRIPADKDTKVTVDWIPWTNRVTDWTNALSSGKGGPDVTELATLTPRESPPRAGWPTSAQREGVVVRVRDHRRQPGQRHGERAGHAVPWFGGVRGIWHRKDESAKAGITRPPPPGAAGQRRQAAGEEVPGTNGLGAPSEYTNAIVSFIWGAGGQVATKSGGKWTAG